MPLAPAHPALVEFITQVYLDYAALMRTAGAHGGEPLGGKLLYAGELNEPGRRLAIAGNIAGAATLAATSDQAAGRQAMRDGAVDFVVTTLDEALRILKNQIRKREPASVCVGAAPEEVEREMHERGVEPDLLPQADYVQSGSLARPHVPGARDIVVEPFAPGQTLFTVEIPAPLSRQSAEIEEVLAASLALDDYVNRRWLHFSPRYLGPGAQRIRSLVCDHGTAEAARPQLDRIMNSR